MADDIDFFTYPQRYFEEVIEEQSDVQRMIKN